MKQQAHGRKQGVTGSRDGGFAYLSLGGQELTRGPRYRTMVTAFATYIHEAMRKAVRSAPRVGAARRGALSARELEVLKWTMGGKTNWQISRIFCISERTVKFHVHRILSKLDASSRAHAVAIAVTEGLIVGPPVPGAS